MICKSSNKATKCANCVVKNKSIFSLLDDVKVVDISNYVEKNSTYSTGEYLINEHQNVHYSLCLKSGYLIIGSHLEDGSRQIFKVIFPGEFISFSKNQGNYGYFVQAVTNVEVCIINNVSVKKLLKEHNDVAVRLIETLSDNSHLYQQHLLGMGRKHAKEALAFLIMDLYTRVQKDTDNRANNDELHFFPLNQEGMADILGLTKVHISRVISQFKKDKLIECSHRKLKVLDEDKLSAIGSWSAGE
jgi:CRP/FNR family transcriptional regulator